MLNLCLDYEISPFYRLRFLWILWYGRKSWKLHEIHRLPKFSILTVKFIETLKRIIVKFAHFIFKNASHMLIVDGFFVFSGWGKLSKFSTSTTPSKCIWVKSEVSVRWHVSCVKLSYKTRLYLFDICAVQLVQSRTWSNQLIVTTLSKTTK